ncbi:MAG TPA: hypothetical protein VLW26_03310 [Steroidobacteraceae bacterium]|nr:hypothetical protein [Steroidobacteraceae bacterium]
MKIATLSFAAACLLAPVLALAQAPAGAAPAPTFARGVIRKIDDKSVTLKGADGKLSSYALAKDWTVNLLKPVSVKAIQPGSFIGTAEMPQADGTGRSLEVHVFPPGVKAGEGHYPWDSQQGAMMTNGTVGKVVSGAKGRTLTVTYPRGERQIVVPKGVPIVQFSDGDRALVKPGIPAFLLVLQTPEGPMTPSISIGVNGAKPPM